MTGTFLACPRSCMGNSLLVAGQQALVYLKLVSLMGHLCGSQELQGPDSSLLLLAGCVCQTIPHLSAHLTSTEVHGGAMEVPLAVPCLVWGSLCPRDQHLGTVTTARSSGGANPTWKQFLNFRLTK